MFGDSDAVLVVLLGLAAVVEGVEDFYVVLGGGFESVGLVPTLSRRQEN